MRWRAWGQGRAWRWRAQSQSITAYDALHSSTDKRLAFLRLLTCTEHLRITPLIQSVHLPPTSRRILAAIARDIQQTANDPTDVLPHKTTIRLCITFPSLACTCARLLEQPDMLSQPPRRLADAHCAPSKVGQAAHLCNTNLCAASA